MIYRSHGKTGKELSIVGFGGMRFAEIDNRDRCVEMMLEAAKLGINYFDTAPAYFGTKSEEVFGEGFNELKRHKLPFYSSTKTFKASEKEIRTEIEHQLKRLNLDSIDFYHVWCITNLENWRQRKKQGVVEAFIKLKEEGLVHHLCVSSHLIGDQIKELLEEDLFEAVLFGYSAYNFSIRQIAFETITARDLGCVVMNPLGGGIIPENPETFAFIKTKEQQSVVEAALHFLFAHEKISTALVGFSTLSEIRTAVRAVDGYSDFPDSEMKRIKAAHSDAFQDLCTGCQYCDLCPEGIPVPKLMDAYNHKLLYGKNEKLVERLKWHWDLPPQEAAACVECGKCEEACTQHLPIMERLKEIASLAAK